MGIKLIKQEDKWGKGRKNYSDLRYDYIRKIGIHTLWEKYCMLNDFYMWRK